MIRYKWEAKHHFLGWICRGEVEASGQDSALIAAASALEQHPDCFGGNVDKNSLRLTHQLRPGKKKWRKLGAGK